MSTRSGSRKYPLKVYLLYYYGKIIGLCPLSYSEEEFHISNVGTLYIILLCVLHSIIFYQTIIFRLKTIFPIESVVSAVWDTFFQIFQYIVIIVSWMNFGLGQKKLENIVADVKKTGEIARNLGIRKDDLEMIRLITNYVIFINALYFVLWILEVYVNSFYDSNQIILWALNSAAHIVHYNMMFLFISALHILYQRFRQLNLKLRYFLEFRENTQEPSFRILNSEIAITIETFGILHRELLDLLENVTSFFFLPMLIAVAANFLEIVETINMTYLLLRKDNEWNIMLIFVVFHTSTWTFVLLLNFFIISTVSGNLREMANNTGNVLHKMWVIYKPFGCQRNIRKVSLMLLQRKATISLCGFLSLDDKFFYEICGIVTTYLVIILQLDN